MQLALKNMSLILFCILNSTEIQTYRGALTGGGTVRIPVYCDGIREWSVEFETAYDEEVLDFETVKMAAEKAGRYSAIGTYRPRFGRFTSEVIDHG